MLKRGLYVIVVVLTAGIPTTAQVGTWRSYTSMAEVRDVVRVGPSYWAASSGGLFELDAETSAYRPFTNAEGLLSNDLTAVGVDESGNVWSGTASGHIHVFSPATGIWRYVLDISFSAQTSKRINRFETRGDTVFICTDFGLSLFFGTDFVFGDTYTKFGSELTNVRVSAADVAVYDDSIWVAISDQSIHRIAVASLSNPNRLPPDAWSLRQVGTETTRPTVLAEFNGRLYVGTTSGVYYREGASWIAVPALAGKNIVSAVESASQLSVCTSTELLVLDLLGNVTSYPTSPFSLTSITLDDAGQPVSGSLGGGVLTYSGSWVSHFPDGPHFNQFLSVTVDLDGNVWGASGINSAGKGLARFDETGWMAFTKDDGLPTNDYYRVSVSCDGSVWASSWGWGVVEFLRGQDFVDTAWIYNTNVGMEGLPDAPEYIVVTNVVCDANGNRWMSINSARDTEILVVLEQDSMWTMLPVKTATSRISTLFFNVPLDQTLAVDAYGNLWGGSRDLTFKGVFSLGNAATIDDSIYALVTNQDGLPSNDITTVVVDRDNDIWVGTEKGIGIILDPLDPTGPGGIALYIPLNGLVINTIVVDPLNRKWVGTPDGVVLLSTDGTQELATYTVENTGGKLIDNDVKSIAVDPGTGTVYFGTLIGLSSLTTSAGAPQAEFDKLAISPNPYLVPSATPVSVDGLVENSTLKILTIEGRLVREIFSPGGRVGFWDGKDEEGKDAASGIYIVVAYSSDGTKVATGKLAVVKR